MYEDRERILQNNKLVKTIIEIQRRKPQYVDILDRRTEAGQNIYHLAGNHRDLIYKKVDYKQCRDAEKVNTDRTAIRIKTIPNSNLSQRKMEVLRIHKENLRMVKALATMKAHQDILLPVKSD